LKEWIVFDVEQTYENRKGKYEVTVIDGERDKRKDVRIHIDEHDKD
jgi:hypothetical protein